MEDKNYVRLDLDKYQDLVDFKRNILNGKIATISISNRYSIYYYTECEIVNKLTIKYNSLHDDNQKLLIKYNDELNRSSELIKELEFKSKPKKLTLEDFKKMNIWQLIKWKLNN